MGVPIKTVGVPIGIFKRMVVSISIMIIVRTLGVPGVAARVCVDGAVMERRVIPPSEQSLSSGGAAAAAAGSVTSQRGSDSKSPAMAQCIADSRGVYIRR